ncbi:MAG TPA: hypothetical protein VG694_00710 [Candidatus Paceibacterota bacterium]|nr:hypothetical protein [Candidatus Paceibacterota bacterium]
MTDTVIHHIRVSYDEDDPRVRSFVAYLKDDSHKDEMLGYYGSAKESHPSEKYVMKEGNDFSLSISDNGVCHIRLRGM